MVGITGIITETKTGVRLATRGKCNKVAYSYLMEACTKGPDIGLLKLCETRLAIEDEKVVQRLLREFHRFEMLYNEPGPKFVVRMKSHVAKIASQNETEVPTDTAIITVAEEGIRLQHPMLYQVL